MTTFVDDAAAGRASISRVHPAQCPEIASSEMSANYSGTGMPSFALRSVPLKMPKLSQDLLTSSELDSENAHFDMTEALMSAIEEASNADLQVGFAPAWAVAATAYSSHREDTSNPIDQQICRQTVGYSSQESLSRQAPGPFGATANKDTYPARDVNSLAMQQPEPISSAESSVENDRTASGNGVAAQAPDDSDSNDNDEDDSDSSGSEGLDALIAHRNQLHSTVAALSRSHGSEIASSTASARSDAVLGEADLRRQHFRYHQLHPSLSCPLCRHVRDVSPLATATPNPGSPRPRGAPSPQPMGPPTDNDGRAEIPRVRSASRVLALSDSVRSDRSSSVDSLSHQSDASDVEWTRGWNAVRVTRPASLGAHMGAHGASTRSKVEETARGFLQSLPAAAGGTDGVPPAMQPMVDEDDDTVPQGLLPTPEVSFDDMNGSLHEDSWVDVRYRYKSAPASAETTLRGSEDWAPPRQQLIFHPHMRVTKSEALCKQNHRCAGCGLSVERSYVSSFKYCEYIGRYFCSSCHSKTLHPIPARILWKWDFRSYPISKFARDLLRRIWGDPLFNVADVNCNLYARARPLQNARELRLQLQLVRTYLASCTSDSVTLRELNVTIPEDVDVYSMRQLVGVRDGTFLTYLHDLIHEGVKHVRTCVLCTAKGFICELCNANQIIFPFETGLTMQCRQCQACYHSKCWARHGHCPKCRRIAKYRRAQKVRDTEVLSDS